MNAALIWIIFPGLIGGILFLIRRWQLTITIIGTSVTLLLAVLAMVLPFGELITLGPWAFKISETLTVAGRFFLIENADRPLLTLIYLTIGFWFGGSLSAKVNRFFVPLGLAMVSMLIAALAVQPFLYAALLIEIAVLISVPILSPPGTAVGKGVIRYLAFQSLGIPFILLAGWFLTGIEGQPDDAQLVLRITILVSLAFSFLLAVFPLNTWIPLLAAETHPFAAAFIFSTIPSIIFLFAIGFVEKYPWLFPPGILQYVGVLIVVTGGLFAAFQNHLGRLMGYAVIIGIGHSILVISLQTDIDLYFALFIPKLVSLGVWALALSSLRSWVPDLSFESVKGVALAHRLAGAAAVVATFSLAGVPLLANFPFYLLLWEQLSEVSSSAAIWLILGSAGLVVGGLRSLAVVIMDSDHQLIEAPGNIFSEILMGVGLTIIFFLGVYPQAIQPIIQSLSAAF